MTLSFPAKGISVHPDSGTLCDKHTIVFQIILKRYFSIMTEGIWSSGRHYNHFTGLTPGVF